ncbi:MAG: iron-sulfur cluster repair di-iron protein [Lentimicrobiaceae bacterium]|nr:iron-sulfur cluster repair di-iron protein [Lentimicrobiaceae bacterium]
MELDPNVFVSEVVSQNFQAADVFSRHGIDFCCGGHISLEQAARKSGTDVSALIVELNDVMKEPDRESDLFRRLAPDELCRYIVDVHHTYVRTNIMTNSDYLSRIVMAHGDRHPELETVQRLFQVCAVALTTHMQKEEVVLFPFISRLVKARHLNEKIPEMSLQHIENPMSVMEAEHDEEGRRFREISRLTQGYSTPSDACNTYRVAMQKLQDFEQDLHRHIHLENNILFPAARLLAKEVLT